MRTNRREVLRGLSGLMAWRMARAFAQAIEPESAEAGPVRLVNGAAAAGLNFVLRNDARGRKYQVETLPGGLAVIDFDGDGWPDLFCANAPTLPGLTK
jgi:enediyne biosynthesis protein E4